MSLKRWRKAQKSEEAFYKNGRSKNTSAANKDIGKLRQQSIKRICEYTELSEDELKNLRILEIGGQTVKLAFGNVSTLPKYILDPLFAWNQDEQNTFCHRIRGIGEYLPLRDNCIDICLCFNTIDHTISPADVLDEINRVLVDRGMLVIMCHTFPVWTTPFIPLFNIVDLPHPHHFTFTTLNKLLTRRFHIENITQAGRIFKLSRSSSLKENIAALVSVKYFMFRCISTM